jgi:ABC-2 type transport system permease protein
VVATLVRLRLLVLRNTLRRQTAQLVVVIIAAVYGLGILLAAVLGLIFLDLASTEVIRTAVVLAGGAALLGWGVLPLVATGIDETLEPARLAAYPIPLRQLMTGLFLGGVLGVPGIVTTIAALCTALSWRHLPGVAVVALLTGILGAASCVVASRAAAAIGSGLSTGRRFREARGLLLIIPIILLGPIVLVITGFIERAHTSLGVIVDVVSWTPVGAVWAVPASVALGDPVGALARSAIALATFGVLVLAWRWGLAKALVTPVVQGGGRSHTRGRLGLFGNGVLGAFGPVGAVAARCLTYWIRDPRYQRQLILIPILPVLLGFYATLNHTHAYLLALGPVTAFFLSVTLVTDVSYDGSAFTLHVARGVRGVADRAGRATALLVFALPVVVVFAIGGAAFGAASASSAPALVGLAVGVLGSGVGVASVSSALLVLPVPAPGDNPFRSRPGTNLSNTLQMLVVWGILGVLCLPEIVLLVVAALTHAAVWGWVGLVVGIVLGAVFLVLGVNQGGALLDRRAPELLVQLNRAR